MKRPRDIFRKIVSRRLRNRTEHKIRHIMKKKQRTSWFFWPFFLLWYLVCGIVSLVGRLAAIVLAVVMIVLGIVLCVTLVGAIAGIPLIVIGAMLLFSTFR